MTIENRLIQMKKYLEEALLDPENNKLYIEDLKLSISHFEANVTQSNDFALMSGFAIDN